MPIKDYNGEEEDLTLKAMTKYLFSLIDLHDITDRIASDFYIPLFLPHRKNSKVNLAQRPGKGFFNGVTDYVN